MKVVIVHSKYRYKGGEDSVVFAEQSLVPNAKLWTRSNSIGPSAFIQFLISIYNPFVGYSFRSFLRKEKPDVVHVHNINFALGPIIIRIAKNLGIPVVMTLHNYRLICPSATLLHKGVIFKDSIKANFPWKAIRAKVYRNSLLQTFWLAVTTWFHRKIGTWEMVDRFIVLTESAKTLFSTSHLQIDDAKLVVKPNFVTRPSYPMGERSKAFLFVGRLSEEKGVNHAIQAAINIGCTLRIAGDGPLKEKIEKVSISQKNIIYLGNLSADDVQQEMRECTALVFPSIWYEGMPMTIIEAFLNSTPVIASKLGAMECMIKNGSNGLHFLPANSQSIADTMTTWLQFSDHDRLMIGANAFEDYLKFYSPGRNLEILTEIYTSVVNSR